MGKKWGILVLILLLLVPAVYANQGSTKLLALITKGDTQYGTAATLDLDIQQGQNRVFLETFPLTKISTQVSMRFAQQVVCSELDVDCSNYDFFYTKGENSILEYANNGIDTLKVSEKSFDKFILVLKRFKFPFTIKEEKQINLNT